MKPEVSVFCHFHVFFTSCCNRLQHPMNCSTADYVTAAKPFKNEVFRRYTNPLKEYGLVRVKYGFSTGLLRVWKTRGLCGNPMFVI